MWLLVQIAGFSRFDPNEQAEEVIFSRKVNKINHTAQNQIKTHTAQIK